MSLRSNYTPVVKVESLLNEKNKSPLLKTFKSLKSIYENTKLTHGEIDFLREIGLLKKFSESKLYKFTLSHFCVGYALTFYQDNKNSDNKSKITLYDIRNANIIVDHNTEQYSNTRVSEIDDFEDNKESSEQEPEKVELNFFERLWRSIKNIFQ